MDITLITMLESRDIDTVGLSTVHKQFTNFNIAIYWLCYNTRLQK